MNELALSQQAHSPAQRLCAGGPDARAPQAYPVSQALAHRVDAIEKQWHDARLKMVERGWHASQRHSRARRRIPLGAAAAATGPLPTTTEEPDAVLVEFVQQELRIKKSYSLGEVLRALSSCGAPFSHALVVADQLAAASGNPTLRPSQSRVLSNAAAVFDIVASFDPKIAMMQSLCNVARISANVLEGQPLTAQDVLDVTMLYRNLLTPKVGTLSGVKRIGGKGAKGGGDTSSGTAAISLLGQPHASGRYRGPLVRDRTESGYIERGKGGESDGVQEPGSAQTFELRYSEEGERALASPPGRLATHIENPESSAADATAPDASLEIALGVQELFARQDAMQRPVRLRTALVGNVPLRADPSSPGGWQQIDLRDYRVAEIDTTGRTAGDMFVEGEAIYVCVDDFAVRVRALARDQYWVVGGAASSGERMPPLPMRQIGKRWFPTSPTLDNVVAAENVAAGADGFIRVLNRKFIKIGTQHVEVLREGLVNEEAIASLALDYQQVLPSPDGAGVITLTDGTLLIEGRYGYYRLQGGISPAASAASSASASASSSAASSASSSRASSRPISRASSASSSSSAVLEGVGTDDVMRRIQVYFDADAERWRVVEDVDEAPRSVRPAAKEDGAADKVGNRLSTLEEEDDHALMIELNRDVIVQQALMTHYRTSFSLLPFFDKALLKRIKPRRALSRHLDSALTVFDAVTMLPGNLMGSQLDDIVRPTLLAMRKSIARHIQRLVGRDNLNLQERQFAVSKAVSHAYDGIDFSVDCCWIGYCNEISDLTLNVLSSSSHLKKRMLQIVFKDLRGSGRRHVMLLYADDPASFASFGDMETRDTHILDNRPTLSSHVFQSLLWQNRDSWLLIDIWASQKLIDFSSPHVSEASVSRLLIPNLQQARIIDSMGGSTDNYEVRAVLPPLPARTSSANRLPRDTAPSGQVASSRAFFRARAEGVALPGQPVLASLIWDLIAAASSPEVGEASRAHLDRLVALFRRLDALPASLDAMHAVRGAAMSAFRALSGETLWVEEMRRVAHTEQALARLWESLQGTQTGGALRPALATGRGDRGGAVDPQRTAWVDGVPMLPILISANTTQWVAPFSSVYRSRGTLPDFDGAWHNGDGRSLLRLNDGYVYSVREILPDVRYVVDDAWDRSAVDWTWYPPRKLTNETGDWTLQAQGSRAGTPAPVPASRSLGSDHFLRKGGGRFVSRADGWQQSLPPAILGERRLAGACANVSSLLPAPDPEGLIRSGEGGPMLIEGRHGYYEVTQDIGDTYVVKGGALASHERVAFDGFLQRWRVLGPDVPGAERPLDVPAVSTPPGALDGPTVDGEARSTFATEAASAFTSEATPAHPPESRRHASCDAWTSALTGAPFFAVSHRAASREALQHAVRCYPPRTAGPGGPGDVPDEEGQHAVRLAIEKLRPTRREWARMTRVLRQQDWVTSRGVLLEIRDLGGFGDDVVTDDDRVGCLIACAIEHLSTLKRQLMPVVFDFWPATSRRHVALLYVDVPELLRDFGDGDTLPRDSAAFPRPLPSAPVASAADDASGAIVRVAFAEWLYKNRDSAVLIDIRDGPLDLSGQATATDMATALDAQLSAAGFPARFHPLYMVRAYVPQPPGFDAAAGDSSPTPVALAEAWMADEAVWQQ